MVDHKAMYKLENTLSKSLLKLTELLELHDAGKFSRFKKQGLKNQKARNSVVTKKSEYHPRKKGCSCYALSWICSV